MTSFTQFPPLTNPTTVLLVIDNGYTVPDTLEPAGFWPKIMFFYNSAGIFTQKGSDDTKIVVVNPSLLLIPRMTREDCSVYQVCENPDSTGPDDRWLYREYLYFEGNDIQTIASELWEFPQYQPKQAAMVAECYKILSDSEPDIAKVEALVAALTDYWGENHREIARIKLYLDLAGESETCQTSE